MCKFLLKKKTLLWSPQATQIWMPFWDKWHLRLDRKGGIDKEAGIWSGGWDGMRWQGRVRRNRLWVEEITCEKAWSWEWKQCIQITDISSIWPHCITKSNKKSSPMCTWLTPWPPSSDFSLSISFSLFKVNFGSQQLSRRHRDFPYTSCPPPCVPSLLLTPPPSSRMVHSLQLMNLHRHIIITQNYPKSFRCLLQGSFSIRPSSNSPGNCQHNPAYIFTILFLYSLCMGYVTNGPKT